jgi:hypothetical protein
MKVCLVFAIYVYGFLWFTAVYRVGSSVNGPAAAQQLWQRAKRSTRFVFNSLIIIISTSTVLVIGSGYLWFTNIYNHKCMGEVTIILDLQ